MLMADMTDDQRAAVTALWQAWLSEGAELLELVDVLWSGWECDHSAALIRDADGAVRIKILSGVARPADAGPLDMLEERIGAYQQVIEETRRFLAIACAALGQPNKGPGWACGSCGRAFHDPQAVCPACGAEEAPDEP